MAFITHEVFEDHDGFLFLLGGSNRVSEFFTLGQDKLSLQAQHWKDLLLKRAQRIQRSGGRYAHLFAPEKLSVYQRRIPGILEEYHSFSELIEETYAATELNGVLVPVLNYIRSALPTYSVYSKTDSHWTSIGCYRAYQMICSAAGIPERSDLFKKSLRTSKYTGDLAEKLAHRPKEAFERSLMPVEANRVWVNDLIRRNEAGGNQEAHVGCMARFENSSHNVPALRVLLFGDSFSEYRPGLLTGMLADSVQELLFAWSASIDWQLIENYRPDIVISETSERFGRLLPLDGATLTTQTANRPSNPTILGRPSSSASKAIPTSSTAKLELDPLSLIAIRQGGDKFGSHLYTPIYDSLFREMRTSNVKVLELGVGGYGDVHAGGSSLLTWSTYFPNGIIIGLDISKKEINVPDNVKILQGSQADKLLLAKVSNEYGPFDIIIDDASHQNRLTQESFAFLYPLMRSTGIYIVEDVQTAFYPASGGRTDGQRTIFELALALALAMHKCEGFRPNPEYGYFETTLEMSPRDQHLFLEQIGRVTKSVSIYRNLIIFHRGENDYPSNSGFDLTHPKVRQVYETMEDLARQTPGPRDALARIDMNIWARQFDTAAQLAIDASNKYPNDLSLLYELRYLMKQAQRTEETMAIEQKIASLNG
jgi:alginate O-acetyltransferase complex protein AlgJ